MSKAVTTNGCTDILAMSSHHWQDARAISRETVGCELAAEVLRSFGSLRLRVVGGSMIPAIWPGDVLSVNSYGTVDALPGDIVVFRREGRLVTHRAVEVRSQESGVRIQEQSPKTNHQSAMLTFVTRGDRVRRNDAPVSSRELLGRVTAIERGSRQFTPRQSLSSRFASWILSRSDLCTRMLLWLRSALSGRHTP
jgi:signal peptidase I